MRLTSSIAAGAALVAGAAAENYLGFNSGATLADRSAKFKADFKAEFETAQNLEGAPGDFNAVRLYTNIQAYSQEDPIEAFEAAIETNTKILLGVWASGTDSIDKEINALKKAIDTHGDKLTDLFIGVSIGSEDLYRNSATGVENEAGIGNQPKNLVGFIDDWRNAFQEGPVSKVPVGHVDTWDVWGNATNKVVVDAIDFIGVDEYPYYETGKGNHIDNAGQLFDRAFQATVDASQGKPIWVTETGWPYKGPTWDKAVPSIKNAKTYWDQIGCRRLFGEVPTFWYTLRDSNPDNEMKFAITEDLSTEPLFDLSCPESFDDPSTTSSAAQTTKTGSSDATTTFASSTPSGTPGAGEGGEGGSDNENGNNGGSGGNGGSGNGGNGGSDESTNGGEGNGEGGSPEGAGSSLTMFSAGTYVAMAVAGGAFALF